MRRLWHRYVASLTLGVRVLLLATAVLYLVAWIGKTSRSCDLYGWLGLSPSAFCSGRLWVVVTYALLPSGLFDLFFNCFMIGWLGVYIERAWSRWGLWSYCLLTAAGGGAAKVLLARFDASMMVGAAPVVYGLLAAWMRLSGHERVQVWLFGETTVFRVGLALMALSSVFMLSRAGLVKALVVLSGALAGWLYLSLRWKLNRAQPGHRVGSERVRRLEL
jgi:membrane associated rhomboid family serine protease